jgi:hypothetical protein
MREDSEAYHQWCLQEIDHELLRSVEKRLQRLGNFLGLSWAECREGWMPGPNGESFMFRQPYLPKKKGGRKRKKGLAKERKGKGGGAVTE